MLSEERVERYELLGELATGGMATVYLGRQRGPLGFSRTVAIKSMHPQFAKDEGFRAMFLDEATLTSRIRHPNVVPTLDIVIADTKVLLVMEYVDGVSLSTLVRASRKTGRPLPLAVAIAIVCDSLHGLHAAHELLDEEGAPLQVVHRDISPQNIHVGSDGHARVLDFGVAKAASRRYVTQSGEVKGKISYMSPEQLCGEHVDRRTDVYAAGVVLWEVITGHRLFDGTNEGEVVRKVLEGKLDPPSFRADEELPAGLDELVMKSLAPKPEDRFASAEEMAYALAGLVRPATHAQVTSIVRQLAGEELESRKQRLRPRDSSVMKIEMEPEVRALANVLHDHVTQATSTRSRPPEPPKQSRFLAFLGTAFVLVMLVLGAFVIGARMNNLSAKAAMVPPSSATPPVVSATAPLPEPTPKNDVAADPPAPPAPKDPAPIDSGKKKPTTTPIRKPPRTVTTGTPSKNCNPPYTVDAQGDRHYKPECVE